jgi:hypothetical protein
MADIAAFASELGKLPFDDNHSVFDLTTFVVSGEFSRTPRLNAFNGKDHNFRSNSIFFLGKNVRPGVFGASGERQELSGSISAHAGLSIDFADGRPSEQGEILKTRNLWAGAGSVLGCDVAGEFGAQVRPVRFLGG